MAHFIYQERSNKKTKMSTYKITINQQEHLVEDQAVDQLNAIETGANQFQVTNHLFLNMYLSV